ncbi:MAG: hypothetical protein UY97_C0019G0008 [Parcubacteria group bacterium GW2011_GWB1_57_6]|nr:MAG: hypothetical protein UY93_C0002G0119 [Parcubacteria group bacterium GW2011_GWA1_56_13]KKW45562.1 MAG: hypothetical protein UY97_C0019G0008 [Parcubacteria group bacterium GW2011_GWB1_57_6]
MFAKSMCFIKVSMSEVRHVNVIDWYGPYKNEIEAKRHLFKNHWGHVPQKDCWYADIPYSDNEADGTYRLEARIEILPTFPRKKLHVNGQPDRRYEE